MKPTRILKLSIALTTGFICVTFAGINWHFAIAAWMAPVFILYFLRNTKLWGFLIFFFAAIISGALSQTGNNLSGLFLTNIMNGLSFGIVYSLSYLVDKLLYKKNKKFYSTLIFPSAVILVETLASLIIGTWGIVAHTQFTIRPIIQLASLSGAFGISFLVSWFGAVLNWLIENDFTNKSLKRSMIYFLVFVLVFIWGEIQLNLLEPKSGRVKIATVSSHINIITIFSREQEGLKKLTENPNLTIPAGIFSNKQSISTQLEKTKLAAKNGAKIIVWNECSLVLTQKQATILKSKIKDIARKNKCYILIAFLEQSNQVFGAKPFNNTNILITDRGKIGWQYLKSYLHPTAEAPFINNGEFKIPYLDTKYGRLGSVICYDLDIPRYIRQAGRQSIDIMLVPAFDWEGITPLHSNMAALEAIQNGFSLIRSNGNGLSAVYDYHGNIQAQLNTIHSSSKILYSDVPCKATNTIYSKTGNIFAYLCLLFLLTVLTVNYLKHRKKKNS